MREFPKWLLALAFLSLTSVLSSPFYMFGGVAVFGHSEYAVVNFLLFLLQNLLWVLPVLLFFGSLELYRIGLKRAGVAVVSLGLLLTILCFVLLLI
ncbi:MAG: hypothetical protein Q4E59_06520 [Bacteroidales bacterium]|nr:hypothetical protein [Bacteroidales bacterium]